MTIISVDVVTGHITYRDPDPWEIPEPPTAAEINSAKKRALKAQIEEIENKSKINKGVR